MKIILTILLIIIIEPLIGQSPDLDTLELENALNKEFVEIEIEGYGGKSMFQSIDGGGAHFGQCITITLESITDSSIIINVPVGSILKCKDTTVQDMIVTKSFFAPLYSWYTNYKVGYLFYAMCGEINDASPGQGNYFEYGGLAEPNVVSISKVIEKNNHQGIIGQWAMWAVRNEADTTKLMHYGATHADLQKVVELIHEAKLTTRLTEQLPQPTTSPQFDNNEEKENQNEVILPSEYAINKLVKVFILICGVLIILIVFIGFKRKNKPIT